MTKKILVTGATGYVGGRLVPLYVEAKEIKDLKAVFTSPDVVILKDLYRLAFYDDESHIVQTDGYNALSLNFPPYPFENIRQGLTVELNEIASEVMMRIYNIQTGELEDTHGNGVLSDRFPTSEYNAGTDSYKNLVDENYLADYYEAIIAAKTPLIIEHLIHQTFLEMLEYMKQNGNKIPSTREIVKIVAEQFRKAKISLSLKAVELLGEQDLKSVLLPDEPLLRDVAVDQWRGGMCHIRTGEFPKLTDTMGNQIEWQPAGFVLSEVAGASTNPLMLDY